jgi:hypothetical protein
MADKTGDKPPESPTTARELDFDDDDVPASASAPAPAATAAAASAPAAADKTGVPAKAVSPKPGVRFSEQAEEIPPQKPPRPMSPQQQAQNTLIEAFPDIDNNVIKAVLVASGGKVEPAFHALLTMSDPDAQRDETPPPQPPRPQPRSQLEQDELYARQLAEHYHQQGQQGQQGQHAQHSQVSDWPPHPQRRQTGPRQTGPPQHDDGREHNFFDDDLPEIRKNIEQGFIETQKTVNKWITSFKKKLDGEPDEYDQYGNPVPVPHGAEKRRMQQQQRRDYGPSTSDQMHGIRKNAEPRRSADHTRYDADNRVLGDDFAQLELRDNEVPSRTRPSANPDLFKPTPVSPPQSGPVDEVDALYRNPSPNSGLPAAKASGKKWQPLTSVAPHPEPDEHDPFSLGDSDDEEARTKDLNPEDTERLKKAAQNKQATVSAELEPARRSGSVGQKDAAAEALLKEADAK